MSMLNIINLQCAIVSDDKHSINIGILISSTTKYINMCSILFIVPFYLII